MQAGEWLGSSPTLLREVALPDAEESTTRLAPSERHQRISDLQDRESGQPARSSLQGSRRERQVRFCLMQRHGGHRPSGWLIAKASALRSEGSTVGLQAEER